jgi:hypothetical protein
VSNTNTLSYDDTKAIVQQFVNKTTGSNAKPKSMVHRYARYSPNTVPTQKPPYNTSDLDRFEDTFRSDGVAQRGIIKRVYLIMGKYGKIVMDTTEEYDSEEERKAAIQRIQQNKLYQDAKAKMQKLHIKPAIDFHNNVMAAVIQAKTYARSALEIILERNELGYELPIALHICNSKRLGKVEIETTPNTWAFKGVHYLDMNQGPTGMSDLLYPEQIMYFANKDWHISPGSLYYGLSDLETVVDGSEAKRIAKQEDIKEIFKSIWAPFLIIKCLNPSITTEQMQDIIDSIQPGLPMATKQDIDTKVEQMAGELDKIPDVIDFLNRETIRDLGLPAFITGYEQIANYANSQQILLALKEIELEAERTWLSGIIERQWLNRYFYQILGYTVEDEPEVKLKYEYSDITFETTLDKVNAALPLFDRKLYSGEKVLKIADADDEIDEYKLREEEQKALQEQRFGMELKRMDMEEMLAKNQVSTTMQKRQAQLSKEDIYQKMKDKLDTI